MGEDNMVPAGHTFYFCRTEDIGTPEEKWTKMKVTKMKGLSSEPETSEKSAWKTKISFNMTAAMSDRCLAAWDRMRKKNKGRRHYRWKATAGKRDMRLFRKRFRWIAGRRLRRKNKTYTPAFFRFLRRQVR